LVRVIDPTAAAVVDVPEVPVLLLGAPVPLLALYEIVPVATVYIACKVVFAPGMVNDAPGA
jgi:hypothetical protein